MYSKFLFHKAIGIALFSIAMVFNLNAQNCNMTPTVVLNNNQHIAFPQTWTNQNIRISGTVFFDANVTMIQCRVYMMAGAVLNVNNSTFTLTDNANGQSIIFGCVNKWQSINVNANAAVIFRNSTVRDGNLGLVFANGFQNAATQITGCTFSRNTTAITANNVANLTFATFSGNTFTGPTAADPHLPPIIVNGPVNAFRLTQCVGALGTSGAVNTITDMTVGARLQNSTITMNNFAINNCNNADSENGGAGIGVHAIASSLTLQNLFSSAASGTFVNNRRGIRSFNTILLNVQNASFMGRSRSDIEVLNSTNPYNVTIANNTFVLSDTTVRSIHIDRAAQAGATHTTVQSNIFNLPGGFALRGNMRFIDVLSFPGTTDLAVIANNQITSTYANGGIAGALARTTDAIWIQGSADGYQVSGNLINFANANGAVPPNNNIDGVGIGMIANNGTNNIIGPNNRVTATLFPGQPNERESWLRCGVHVDGSLNTVVCKNDVDEPRSCYHFNGNCGNGEFGRNVIRDGFFGLWMSNIVFPNQDYRMNEWIPGSMYVNRSADITGAANTPWMVDDHCLAGFVAPAPFNPTPFQNLIANGCASGTAICDQVVPPHTGGEGLPLATNANHFINGKISFASYVEAWDYERNLLAQMIRFPNTFANDAVASKYFAQKEHTPIWNFAKAERMLHDASAIDDAKQRILNDVSQQIDQQLLALAKIEKQEGTDEEISAELQEEKSQILAELAALNQKMNSIQAEIADERARRNAVVAGFIKELPESNELEQNQKALLSHQLKLQQAEIVTKSDLAILRKIANSCPKTGGEAVTIARGYLPASESYAFKKEEEVQCASEGTEIAERAQTPQALEVLLFPNPANDLVTVGFSQKFSGSLSIITLDGRVISTQHCDNSIAESVDVASLPTGLYLVQLRDANGKSETRKLSIAH